MSEQRESPYAPPIGLLIAGVGLGVFGVLGLTADGGGGIPEPVGYALVGVGGILALVGIIAVGLVLGAAQTRR